MNCPNCNHAIEDKIILSEAARINGLKTSEKKAMSSRKNGKKGGRPKIKTGLN